MVDFARVAFEGVVRDLVDDAGLFDAARGTVVPDRFDELEAREDLFFVATARTTLTAAARFSPQILDAPRDHNRCSRSFGQSDPPTPDFPW